VIWARIAAEHPMNLTGVYLDVLRSMSRCPADLRGNLIPERVCRQ